MNRHRPPAGCPVCSHRLLLTRLGCEECGTELAGRFEPCRFCSLDLADRELLEVFLRSRGNLKDLARHLDVSYPTARARYDGLLSRLGLEPDDGAPRPAGNEAEARSDPDGDLSTLQALARGEIDVEEALRQL